MPKTFWAINGSHHLRGFSIALYHLFPLHLTSHLAKWGLRTGIQFLKLSLSDTPVAPESGFGIQP